MLIAVYLHKAFWQAGKGDPGIAIHLSQLLLLKSDTTRIRDGIEESAMGSMDLPLPMIFNLAVADCCCTITHSMLPGPCTSRCQSEIKINHSK